MSIFQKAVLAASASLLACAIGCDGQSGDAPEGSLGRVTDEAADVVDAARDYGQARRAELVSESRETLAEFDRRLDDLRDRASQATAEARGELEETIERAESARDRVASEVEGVTAAGAERVAEAEQRLQAALAEAAEAQREIGLALAGREKESTE